VTTPDHRRRYPRRPILGVGAVVIKGNRVLLVERGREPLKGWWSLPGGVLETGERLAEGIRREVLEETGLEVEPLTIVEVYERIIPDAKGRVEYHYVLIDYLCRVAGGKLCASDDACRVRWVARGVLPRYRITEGAVPVIEKAFHLYENQQR
jgi:8-oxo-dGTP diphosphatase